MMLDAPPAPRISATTPAGVGWPTPPGPRLLGREPSATSPADHDALVAQLVQRKPQLQALAMRLCADSAEAADLVQDTYERALRGLEGFAPGTNLAAWLAAILRNLFVDRQRRRRREPTEPLADHEPASPAPEAPPRWVTITSEQIERAVARLEPLFREPYQLHTHDGLSYLEIAQRLGIGVTTVGTRIHRARLKLRAMLDRELAERDAALDASPRASG